MTECIATPGVSVVFLRYVQAGGKRVLSKMVEVPWPYIECLEFEVAPAA